MKIIPLALIAVLTLGTTSLPAATPAPHVSVAAIADLPQPLPLPYDEAANGLADVAKARALARKQHKKLLIDLGGNWCTDCRVLAGIMDLPEVKGFVARNFVVVKVDVGRYDKNGDVASHYGITKRLDGVPAVLIVDPARDRLINKDRTFALTDARHMTPQGLADWLAQWAQTRA
jgi:thiol-disulfide isomerase/thioredoxin